MQHKETSLPEFEALVRGAAKDPFRIFGVVFICDLCQYCGELLRTLESIQPGEFGGEIELYTIEVDFPHEMPLFSTGSVPVFYLFGAGQRQFEGVGTPNRHDIILGLSKFFARVNARRSKENIANG